MADQTRAQIFGANLLRIRQKRGLTRREIATAVGITENAYGAYERGIREPGLDKVFALADALGVVVNDLIEETSTNKGKLFEYRLKVAMSFFDEIDNLTNKVHDDGRVTVTVPQEVVHKSDSPELKLEYHGEYAVVFRDTESFVDAVETAQLRAVYLDTTFIQAFVRLIKEGKTDLPPRTVVAFGK